MLKLSQLYEIVRSNNSLNQAIEQSWQMLDRTRAMFGESVRLLREPGDRRPQMNISAEDQLVNEDQRETRRKVFRHLAVTGSLNLRAGLVLTSIVIDIERIGDYTKNIRELADAHPRQLDSGPYDADIRRIEQAVTVLFEGTVSVVRSGHTDGAESLIREHLWIKRRCDEIVRALVATTSSDLPQYDAVTTALYSRYLKRVGAHLMNILSSLTNPFEQIGYRGLPHGADTAPAGGTSLA